MDNRVLSLGLGIVVLVVALAVGAMITSKVGEQMTPNSTAANVTETGLQAIGDLADWIPILVVAAIGMVVLGYVAGGFMQGGIGRQ